MVKTAARKTSDRASGPALAPALVIVALSVCCLELALPHAAIAAAPKVKAPVSAKLGTWTSAPIVSSKGKTTHFYKFKLKKSHASLKMTTLEDQWYSFAGWSDFFAAAGSSFRASYAKHKMAFQYSTSLGCTYGTYLYNSKKKCIYHETNAEDYGAIDFGYELPAGTYYLGFKIGGLDKSELEELRYYSLRYRFQLEPVAVEQLEIKSASSSKGKIRAKWSEVNWKHLFENGKSAVYSKQIRLSTNRSMKRARTLRTTRATRRSTKCTIKGAKRGTTYYLQIRAGVKVAGQTYWTQWSKTKRVRAR